MLPVPYSKTDRLDEESGSRDTLAASGEALASEEWPCVAAPADDFPAALSGQVKPEIILKAVSDLEQGLALLGEWLRDVQLYFVMRVQGDVPGGRVPCFNGAAVYDSAAIGTILKDHPTLIAAHAKFRAIEREVARLDKLVDATGRLPIADLRRLLDLVLDAERNLRHLLSDTWNRLANIDPLTGLGNRAAMLRRLTIECDRHARTQQPCCLAVLDLDFFKEVNDSFGHAVGDVMLRSVAGLLAASIRPYDEVFRYGGDEFVLCLPNTDLRTAWAIVERLRLRVAQWTVPARSGEPLRATMSIGVAPLSATIGVDASLELADRALYRAKTNGRNTIAVCAG